MSIKKSVKTSERKPAAAKATVAAKTEKPKFLVKLLGCQQVQDPGTKVTLLQNQMVPVPEISKWVKFQESKKYLEIIEL
jgi:hypothetical protein